MPKNLMNRGAQRSGNAPRARLERSRGRARRRRNGIAPMQHIHAQALTDAAPGGFFRNLFEVFTPRQQCMNYQPDVIWLHVVSDAAIAAAYFSIPIALVYFVRRRRDLAFNWMFLMFAAFILACGTTHV